MARVSNVSVDQVPEELRPLYRRFSGDYGPFGNQVSVIAHRPPALRHLMGMLVELSDEALVPKRLVEIAVVTVSKLNACEYCVAHHAPRLVDEGLDAHTIERILEPDPPGLDALERLVRDYAVAVTEQPSRVPEPLFERLGEHFDEAQIVELTLRVALCGFFNRFNESLGIEMEEGVLDAMMALRS